MEGIIGILEFYAPVLALVIIICIVYFMKKRNDKK